MWMHLLSRSSRYPSLLGGQRQHGMRGLPNTSTSTHGRHHDLNTGQWLAVTGPNTSTNRARHCLTSVIRREVVTTQPCVWLTDAVSHTNHCEVETNHLKFRIAECSTASLWGKQDILCSKAFLWTNLIVFTSTVNYHPFYGSMGVQESIWSWPLWDCCEQNVNVCVHVYSPDIPMSSADCTIYILGIGTQSFTVSPPVERIQQLHMLQQLLPIFSI